MKRHLLKRAKLIELESGLIIEIPTKKNWLLIVLAILWFLIWCLGGFLLIGTLLGLVDGTIVEKGRRLIPVFLVFWSVFLLFVGRAIIWMIAGKEVLRFEYGMLTIEKKRKLFSSPRVYNLAKVKNFSLKPELKPNHSSDNGTLKFEYANRKIQIGQDLALEEGQYLLDLIHKNYFKRMDS